MMAEVLQLRRRLLFVSRQHAVAIRSSLQSTLNRQCSSTSSTEQENRCAKERSRWLELPPFAPQVDTAVIARKISGQCIAGKNEEEDSPTTTAVKWVRRCCPDLPLSLVQKLFRLRQVKKTLTDSNASSEQQSRLKRVSAKDALSPGDVLCLPVNVQHSLPIVKKPRVCKDTDEMSFVRSLELYKDDAIIVMNKPPGLPVQGGVGIEHSMDSLASKYLKYDYPDGPRLVHRLDRDSSGVLVLGRDQASATLLHSIFREKTSNALSDDTFRVLQRKYIALVIGVPRRTKGLITVPLAKVVLDDGKSERMTVSDDPSAQHAVTEYNVIESFSNGLTWLELSPLTGRKHQLRVHCAEVLRTPIVGDAKYGWRAHKRWKPVPLPSYLDFRTNHNQQLPFGLNSEGGTISDRRPFLHLHCKQMILPDISSALKMFGSSDFDQYMSSLKKLSTVAPLPSHMQMSWDILKSLS
ncbi:Pseudouridine synthase family protein [Rhynchospora pubera]|uniref:Pseudouridine synthase family protein n=1 Tax=Rhynchospora pubera TaxID=906938 RepID=A0AAV8CH58_9POAL|nr:Pseudouridine synthase family protein [Rhynchospora pubera]